MHRERRRRGEVGGDDGSASVMALAGGYDGRGGGETDGGRL